MKVVVSAPGKLMVAGEYVVLDGAEALVAAVDARLVATGSPRSAGAGDGSASSEGVSADRRGLPPEALLAREHAENALGIVPMELAVNADALRSGERKLGLGSSAAASAAAAGAVLAWGGKDPAEHRRSILRWALDGHRAVAPQGSGADVAAATLGGLVRFTREHAEDAVRVEWPQDLNVEVVWTGHPARTSELVGKVKALESEAPARYEAALAPLREAAAELVSAITEGNATAVVKAADAHGLAMAGLGEAAGAPIVTEELAQVAELARACGGGAKPSGAGGGDVALAFFARAEDASAFREACAEASLRVLDVELGADGVRLDARED